MSAACETKRLDDFPHFKNEWKEAGDYFQHIYTTDQSQIVELEGILMRQLDALSQREAYSFPFCPRVYKYIIRRNQLSNSQINFDLRLHLEHVPHRLHQLSSNEQFRHFNSRKLDLLRTVGYLIRRYGPFRLRPQHLGLTGLGIIKVWINRDFSESCIEEPATSQKQTLEDLFSILKDSKIFSQFESFDVNSFEELITKIQNNQTITRAKNRKPSAYLERSEASQEEGYNQQDTIKKTKFIKPSKSRKNITFSYSNKDIQESIVRAPAAHQKRKSLAVFQTSYEESKILKLKKQFTYGTNNQSSSLRNIIPQFKMTRKISNFHPEDKFSLSHAAKKLNDHFSNSANYSYGCDLPKLNQILSRHENREKPAGLHYSTSSNPCAKLNGNHPRQQKTWSNYQQCQQSQREYSVPAFEQKQNIEQQFQKMFHKEAAEPDMKSSQQVKNDLDALFHSDHDFDYGELQNELDHVLF